MKQQLTDQKKIDLNQSLYVNDQSIEKGRPKVILLHDNAPTLTAKLVKETIEAFSWELLSHAAYSPDLAPSDYYLFTSMRHAFAEQCLTSNENGSMTGILEKATVFCLGIHKLPDRWK